MKAQVEKTVSDKSNAIAHSALGRQEKKGPNLQFQDMRAESVAQRNFRRMGSNGTQAGKIAQFQAVVNDSVHGSVPKEGREENRELDLAQAIFATNQIVKADDSRQANNAVNQRKDSWPPNKTGLPDALKSGIENLSGFSMDNVKVHYNSPKPAQLHAHAFAQGADIHVAPGQVRHLPHEAWHIVQQKQGRVKPTSQVNGGVHINDNVSLENEADVMGARALHFRSMQRTVGEKNTDLTGLYTGNQSIVQSYTDAGALKFLHAPPIKQQIHPMHAQHGLTSDLNQMGVSASVMSNEDYANWRQTAQCKTGLHGACRSGDNTIVTQFKDPDQVAQLFLGQKVKAGLVMAEGALTFIAGIVAIIASASSGAIPVIVPAIMTAVVGALKFYRGWLMWSEDAPEGEQLEKINRLRAAEAAAAVLGAAFLDPSAAFKIPLLIFSLAKTVRSLATIVADREGTNPVIRKGMLGLASLAHALEVASLAVASPAMIAEGGAKLAGGVAVGAVAASKAVRATDQAKTAVNKIREDAPAAVPAV